MSQKVKLTFAAAIAMAAADLFKHVAEIAVKPVEAVEKATTKLVSNLKDAAIGVAALKRLYTQRIEARDIPGDTSFKKYFHDNVGGELPGRVEALANLFNALCLTNDAQGRPLIPEDIFVSEDTPVDWLEKASAIVNAAREKHGEAWKGCDEILDMINALTKPGDAGKKLKEIRERQKTGAKKTGEGEGDETATGETSGTKSSVVVTPQLAAEYLIAAIKNASKLPSDSAATLFELCAKVTDAWEESGVAKGELTRWAKNLASGVAVNMEVRTSKNTPAPKPVAA
jgi:hypothetical protein